jgi:hypothetical protein
MLFALALSCSSKAVSGQGEAEGSGPTLKEEFDTKFSAWEKRCSRIDIAIQSDTSARTNIEEYRALVAMGKPALPLLMEKLEAGEFFLNKAVQEITGIDIAPRGSIGPLEWKPGVRPFSEQDVSERWIEWWKVHKDSPEWKTTSEK